MMQPRGIDVNWNQLLQNGNFSEGESSWYIPSTFTYTIDDKLTFRNTDRQRAYIYSELDSRIPQGHKVIVTIRVQCEVENSLAGFGIQANYNYTAGSIELLPTNISALVPIINTGSTLAVYYMGYSREAYLNKEYVVYFCQIQDLTQMFGAGNEPTTVAQFEGWLTENGINPNEYIPYNAGEIRRMTKPSWM